MSAFGEDQVRERLRMAAGGEWPGRTRERAAAPDPGDVTLAHEEGGGQPETGPHAPETPHAPDAPDLPDSPDLPPHRAPESPDLPDLPEVPAVPDVDGPTPMPDIPGAPGILDSPDIPPTPDIPPPPEIEDMPQIDDMPEIPETPGIRDAPHIPDPPEIDDAPDLPDVTGPTEVPGTPDGPVSPDKPDLPRAPDLPDAPRPRPGGRDGARDAGTAMRSNEENKPELRCLPGGSAAGAGQAEARSDGPGSSERADGADRFAQPDGQSHTSMPHQQRRSADGASAGGSGGAGGSGRGPIPTGGGGGGSDDDGEGEEALRRMLHESVRGIEPSAESLNYLRHAIPARRAQRRRVLAGAAAAVVLAGVGVPALVTTGLMPGVTGDHSINAGDSHDQTRGEGGGNSSGQTQGPDSTAGGSGHSGGKGSKGADGASPSPSAGKESGGANPSDTLATSAPSCGRQQLGGGSAEAGEPDSDGKVYGSFRVVNTSSDACTVEGEGVVGATARGVADSDRINVLDHTPGDAASDLPDPDASPDALVLRPGDAYLVRFAWVPSACPSSGSPSPKVAEAPTADGPGGSENGGNGDSGGGNGSSGGPGTPETGGGDNGETTGDPGGDDEEDASVVLTHTPDVGDPAAANTTLDGACAGTLYRTGVLASS